MDGKGSLLRWAAAAWIAAALGLWLARGWVFWEPVRQDLSGVEAEFPWQALRALAAGGAMIVAACGAAWPVRRLRARMGASRGGWEWTLLDGAAGAALLGTLLLLVPVWLGQGLLAAAFVAGSVVLARGIRLPAFPRTAWPETTALAALAAAMVLLAALAPAVESDGLRYHLFGPQEYLRAGRVVHLPHHALTNLPSLGQMLFMGAMPIGGMRAPQVVHFAFGALAAAFAVGLGRAAARSSIAAARARGRGAHAGRVGAACGFAAAASPVVLLVSSWPFVDLVSAAFLLGGLLVLVLPGRIEPRLLVGSLLLGAAAAAKLPAAAPGVLAGLVMLGALAGKPRIAPRIALLVLPGALVLAPWLVRSTIHHGNPVYPAAFGIFGGPEWSPETDAFYKSKAGEKGIGRTPLDFALFPLDVTIRWPMRFDSPLQFAAFLEGDGYLGMRDRLLSSASPGFEDQNPGPAFLALLPVALAGCVALRRRRPLVLVVLSTQLVGGAIVWFMAYQSVRFLVPVLLVNGALAAWWMARQPAWLARPALALLAAAGIAWTGWYFGASSAAKPWTGALGRVPEDAFIARRFNAFPAVQELNRQLGREGRVFYIGEHRGLYAEFEPILSDWFDTPRILVEIRATRTNEELLARWREAGIDAVLYNGAELSMYRAAYYRPRFTAEEWRRHEDLLDRLGIHDRDAIQIVTIP